MFDLAKNFAKSRIYYIECSENIHRLVGLLAFGEGWHNNHHAFEFSARHGLKWWQIDITWYVVKLLQVLGLATDVKLPNESHKMRMSF